MTSSARIRVRIELPEDLIALIKERAGPRHFSEYVVACVAKRHQQDLLNELSTELQAEFGPVPATVRAQTAKTWPNYRE